MIGLIIKLIIFITTLGLFSNPYLSLAANLNKSINLSDVNPMQALNQATAPLNNLWHAISNRLNSNAQDNGTQGIPGLLKSNLNSSFNLQDTFNSMTSGGILGVVKSAFVLVANISIAVLEAVISILKWLLGLFK